MKLWRQVKHGWMVALALPVALALGSCGNRDQTDLHVPMVMPTEVAHIVSALAIDPAVPATLYAGTQYGVFKSTDGGGS